MPLAMNAPPVPIQEIINPAIAGPITREALKMEELSATAE